MRRSFSITFDLITSLGFLLAGLAIYGQNREWEIPLLWSVVLGCTWLAVLVRLASTVAGVATRVREAEAAGPDAPGRQAAP